MKTVKVDKKELISVLKKNMALHITEYNEMMAAFKKDVIEKTERMLKENIKSDYNFVKSIFVTEPTSNEKDYERALSMLDMSVDDEIILDQNEYNQYVLNEWVWSNSFNHSKAAYFKGD